MVLATAIAVGMLYIKQSARYWYKDVEIEDYGFKISYPNSYIDIPKEEGENGDDDREDN